jgi:hypothetical protein
VYLLLATLVAIGPLVRVSPRSEQAQPQPVSKFGLAEFPG